MLLLLLMLLPSCSERKSEQANGSETELAGVEPDETPLTDDQELVAYNPADTVVNISSDILPPDLREFSQLLLNTYPDIEEALVQDNTAEAKEKAEQMDNMLLRHEQENLTLQPDVWLTGPADQNKSTTPMQGSRSSAVEKLLLYCH